MAIPELDKFREKYPAYNDMSDADLANSLASKYPDAYGDLPTKLAPVDVSAKKQRQDILAGALNEMQQRKPIDYVDPRKSLGVTGTNLKALSGLAQRAEAAASNPILNLQEKGISALNPIEAFKQFRSGLSGKKFGEYGDIARNAGVPEPIAAGIGLAGSMVLDPVGGLISKPANALAKFSNQLSKDGGVRIMNAILNTDPRLLAKGRNLGQEAIEKGIVGSYRTMLSKIDKNLSKTSGVIDNFLSGRSETVDAFKLGSSLDDAFKTRVTAGDLLGARKIKQVQDTILNLSDKNGKIGVAKLNEFKVALNNILGDRAFMVTDAQAALTKARKIASGASADAIEEAVKNVKVPALDKTVAEIQKEVGSNLSIRKAIAKQFADRSNNQILNVIDVVSAINPALLAANIGKRALASSSIGSRIAQAMYKAGKSGVAGVPARIGVAASAETARKLIGQAPSKRKQKQ